MNSLCISLTPPFSLRPWDPVIWVPGWGCSWVCGSSIAPGKAVALLVSSSEGNFWKLARDLLKCNLSTKHLSQSIPAWSLFSSCTICLFPPLDSLPLPRPLNITLFIPLAPALEEERAGPPPQEGRWGRAAPAGREGKRREGRKWPTEEVESGGRALHCFNFFPF